MRASRSPCSAAALKVIQPLEPHSGEPAEVFRKAMNAALTSLDPHSRYLDARGQDTERSAITGSFGGLGLQVELADGLVRIVEPMPDTPAARAGPVSSRMCRPVLARSTM